MEGQPDAASQLNVAASANLAKEAGKGTISWIWCLVKTLHLFIQDISTNSISVNVTSAISVLLICFL